MAVGAALLAGLGSTGATARVVPVEPRYELVDLGTLGGHGSADFSPELLEANAVNETPAIVAVGGNGRDDLVRTCLLRPVDSFDPYRARITCTETGFLPAADADPGD